MKTMDPTLPVQKQLDAYNRRDIDAFIENFAPDVQAFDLTNPVPRYASREAMKEHYGRVFADNPSLHCELKSRTVIGSFVIDEEWVTGNARKPEGVHIGAIYEVRDGLIAKIWFTR